MASDHRLVVDVDAVGDREAELQTLDDAELRRRAIALRTRESGDERTIDALALARESARRALGLRLHDNQIAAGLVLARGAIA